MSKSCFLKIHQRTNNILFYNLNFLENNVIEQSIQEIAIPNPNSIEEKIERQVILELGAGAGHRTLPLIEAMAKNATFTNIVPCDISPEALLQNREYYEKSPNYNSDTSVIQYIPLGGTHQEALAQAATLFSSSSSIFNYMFMGSSLGNYDDDEIVDIITDVARFVLKKAMGRFPCNKLISNWKTRFINLTHVDNWKTIRPKRGEI